MTIIEDKLDHTCILPGCDNPTVDGADLCAPCLVRHFPTAAEEAEYELMLRDRTIFPCAASEPGDAELSRRAELVDVPLWRRV